MGKTQIAVEYVHRHLDEYVYALSANAHSREALVSGYFTIAGLLKLPEADSQDRMLAVEAVKRWPSFLAGPQHSPPLSLTQAPMATFFMVQRRRAFNSQICGCSWMRSMTNTNFSCKAGRVE